MTSNLLTRLVRASVAIAAVLDTTDWNFPRRPPTFEPQKREQLGITPRSFKGRSA